MAHTDHPRPSRRNLMPSTREDVTSRRQPRPAARRTRTRCAAILAAIREA